MIRDILRGFMDVTIGQADDFDYLFGGGEGERKGSIEGVGTVLQAVVSQTICSHSTMQLTLRLLCQHRSALIPRLLRAENLHCEKGRN